MDFVCGIQNKYVLAFVCKTRIFTGFQTFARQLKISLSALL